MKTQIQGHEILRNSAGGKKNQYLLEMWEIMAEHEKKKKKKSCEEKIILVWDLGRREKMYLRVRREW